MSSRPLTRKSKAFTLVPLALLSAAWTASIAGGGVTADAANKTDKPLPGGTSVPSKAIQAPASVPIPGVIAPSVPDGTADSVVGSASTSGIPAPALAAYQRGAQIIDAADTSCNIPWELIAAIGRVESDHGRYGGNTLTENGVSKPGIFGPVLDGKNGTQAITDTDAGQLDKDTAFDRAVGPMQFIPSTWSVVKVDADGDGQRNPQDIDDASLATGVYLCSGTDNLSARKGQEAAVYRYNHSHSYVNLVLRIMEAYSQGDYTAVPSGTYGGTLFSPSYSSEISQYAGNGKAGKHGKAGKAGKGSGGSAGGSTGTGSGTAGSGTGSGSTGGTGTAGGGSGNGGGLGGIGGGSGSVGSVTGPAAQPMLDYAEALTVCNNQLGTLFTNPLTQSLVQPLGITCANKIKGSTAASGPTKAAGILAPLLSALGLHL